MKEKLKGKIGEKFFEKILKKRRVKFEKINSWYDYSVLGNKVEIKSCNLSIKHTDNSYHVWRSGRFDFTSFFNRTKQFDENVWIVFIVRYHEQCIVLGAIKAKELNKCRYISLHKIRELNLYQFKVWIDLLKEQNKKMNSK